MRWNVIAQANRLWKQNPVTAAKRISGVLEAVGVTYFRRHVLTVVARDLATKAYRLTVPSP